MENEVMMSKVVKRIVGFLVTISVFVACHSDDGVKDAAAPDIDLKLLQRGSYVHDVVSVLAEASDNVHVSKIEIYVDDNLVADRVDSTALHLSWNTKMFTDGQHTLTAVAYDKENNTSKKEKVVTIMNTLLTVSVDQDYIGPGVTAYAFISNRQGKMLGVLPVGNSEKLVFTTPLDFKDSVYFYNFFYRTNGGVSGYSQSIASYDTQYSPGSVIELKSQSYLSSAIGDVTVNFSALKDISDFNVSSSSSASIAKSTGQMVIGLSQVSSDLLVVLKGTDGQAYYKYYDAITVGSVITITSLSDFVPMKKTLFEMDAHNFASIVYGGIRNGKYYSIEDGLSLQGPASTSLYSPENSFFNSYYLFLISYGNGGYIYIHDFEGVSPLPTSVTEMEADVKTYSVDGNILTFSMSGPADYDRIMASAHLNNGDKSNHWYLEISSHTTQFVLPEIPGELANGFSIPASNQFDFKSWDLRQTILLGDKNDERYELRVKQKNFESGNSGGRKFTAPDQSLIFGNPLKTKDTVPRHKIFTDQL